MTAEKPRFTSQPGSPLTLQPCTSSPGQPLTLEPHFIPALELSHVEHPPHEPRVTSDPTSPTFNSVIPPSPLTSPHLTSTQAPPTPLYTHRLINPDLFAPSLWASLLPMCLTFYPTSSTHPPIPPSLWLGPTSLNSLPSAPANLGFSRVLLGRKKPWSMWAREAVP